MTTKTRNDDVNATVAADGPEQVLYVAFELSNSSWVMATTVGLGQGSRQRTIGALDFAGVLKEIAAAKRRFGLAEECRVMSCYEAGRDGFDLHRKLTAAGVENVIVDPANIPVPRRKKRRKTDGLDADMLVRLLVRWHEGESKVWSIVEVPSVEIEDERQLSRELSALRGERTRHVNRIKSLVVTQGERIELRKDFLETVRSLGLPPHLLARIEREYERLRLVEHQIAEIEAEQQEMIANPETEAQRAAHRLQRLKGIGSKSAFLFAYEAFGWRHFANRKKVGSYLGLVSAPYDSGDTEIDQGIEKAGNARMRAIAIQIAWSWLRFQPNSPLTKWYYAKFAAGGTKRRKAGIVALARRLMIQLWRYATTGHVPPGVILNA